MIQKTKAGLNLQPVLEAGSDDAFHLVSPFQVSTSAKSHDRLPLKWSILDKNLFPALFYHFNTSIFTSIKMTKCHLHCWNYYCCHSFVASLCDFQFYVC